MYDLKDESDPSGLLNCPQIRQHTWTFATLLSLENDSNLNQYIIPHAKLDSDSNNICKIPVQ